MCVCVWIFFLSFYILYCSDIKKQTFLTGERLFPPWASQLLEVERGPARMELLVCKITHPDPSSSVWPIHPRRQYSSAFIIPGPGARQLKTIPIAQSLSKLFKLANHKLFLRPCLSYGNPRKGCGLSVLLSLLPFTSWPCWCPSRGVLRGVCAVLLSPGPVSVINCFRASPVLPLCSYLTTT